MVVRPRVVAVGSIVVPKMASWLSDRRSLDIPVQPPVSREIPRLHDHNLCTKTALVGVDPRIKVSCPASLGLIIIVLSEYNALDLQLRSLPQCDTLRPQSC